MTAKISWRIAFLALLPLAVTVPTATAAASAPAADADIRVEATAIQAGKAAQAAATAPLPACTDTAYALQSWKHTTTFKWSYNPANAPASVASTALAALQTGTKTVFTGQNRCGIVAKLSTTEAYQGTSTKVAQVDPSGACTGTDGTSVTSWGTLTSTTTLAYTCTYYRSTGSVIESDMLVDNRLHEFYTTQPASCANKWDLVSVFTHERGHTAGLNHVDQATHAVATMSPRTLACDSTERLLSAGDLAGLQSLYTVR